MSRGKQNNSLIEDFFRRYFFRFWEKPRGQNEASNKYLEVLFTRSSSSKDSTSLEEQFKNLRFLLAFLEEKSLVPSIRISFVGIEDLDFLGRVSEVLYRLSDDRIRDIGFALDFKQFDSGAFREAAEKHRNVHFNVVLKNFKEIPPRKEIKAENINFWKVIRPVQDERKRYFRSLAQEIQKKGYPWWKFYLKEEKVKDWSSKTINRYCDFLKWLIIWSFGKCNKNKDRFSDFIFKKEGFGVLAAPFLKNRSKLFYLQNSLTVRMSDLGLIPSFDLNKEALVFARMIPEKSGEVEFEALNPELGLMLHTFQRAHQPLCESCLLHPLCSFGSLKEQLEVTGEIFTPIPSVCKLEHAKVKIIVDTFKKIGVYEELLLRVSNPPKRALKKIDALN